MKLPFYLSPLLLIALTGSFLPKKPTRTIGTQKTIAVAQRDSNPKSDDSIFLIASVKGMDPDFVKGQTLAATILKVPVLPSGQTTSSWGYFWSVAYSTVKGVPTVQGIGSMLYGIIARGTTYQSLTNGYDVRENIIYLSGAGIVNSAIPSFGMPLKYYMFILMTGTYDTSSGAYTVTIKGEF